MQLGFISEYGATSTIFILRLILYLAFVDLERALDRVPRDVVWQALRKLGIRVVVSDYSVIM